MANVPSDLRYTQDHEWVRKSGKVMVVGITDHAQKELGDVVFVELPKLGAVIEAEEAFGTVESVKAVSELFAPVTGKVVKVNTALEGEPDILNTEPYGAGWLIEIEPSDPKQFDDLLDDAAYTKLLADDAS